MAQTETRWRNPPNKPFRFVKDKTGWRMGDVEVMVYVSKQETWVVKGQQTPDLLNHEQGHFDISGLVAREAYVSYQQLRTKTQELLKKKLAELNRRLQRKVDRLNTKYDSVKETNHGMNKANQTKWDKLIQSAIQSGKPIPEK